MPEPRFNVRTFLDPRDDEGHLIARRVSEKKVAELAAASAASKGDDYWPIEVRECPSARFRIKRHALDVVSSRPWVLKDAARPAFLGQYETHALAIQAIDRKVADERGVPTLREIREAMHA